MRRLVHSKAPPAPDLGFIMRSSLGACLAIAITGGLSVLSGIPWLMAPFGASCVLAFGLPESPLAQPRAIIGGHLVATAAGLLVSTLLGPNWLSYAIGVCLALALMQLSRTVHAPAGANPIIVIQAQADWSYLYSPVLLGTLCIVFIAYLVNNWRQAKSYPRYWL